MLSSDQRDAFVRDGYLVIPQYESADYCAAVIALIQEELRAERAPIEYEVETRYPGAPSSFDDEGGRTPRRVKGIYARHPLFSEWACSEDMASMLKTLLGDEVLLSQNHHNCVMTKHPAYSSLTGWHRDSRYWHFQRADLVSAWLALGNEQPENGCLFVIPGSHRLKTDAEQFDEVQFFRTDLPRNQSILAQAIPVPLARGDLLLFHSNLFHAAGRNQTSYTKYSMVFTYRDGTNLPEDHSRSSQLPDIPL